MLDKASEVLREFQKWWDQEKMAPLKVSIMGQTGVGKSSLINALFDTDLNTDPVRPGTTTIQERRVKAKSGHEVIFFDLPGIGEDQRKDKEYLVQYKDKLLESDVAIWAISAESRAFTFDRDALNQVLDTIVDKEQKERVLSKLIFLLTKVDLLTPTTPSPWILYRMHGDDGLFVPTEPILELIRQKESYFSDAFISPFKPLIKGQTYCIGQFKITEHGFTLKKTMGNKFIISYNGFLEYGEKEKLITRYSQYKDVLERLYDNYRVISCSSHFRYNLDLVRRVIIDKLESRSVIRFGGFLNSGPLHTISFSQAIQYINIRPVESNVESQNPSLKAEY